MEAPQPVRGDLPAEPPDPRRPYDGLQQVGVRGLLEPDEPTPGADPQDSAAQPAERAGVATLGSYLIGSRDAILTLARSKHALWIGLLFVFSAAFAREYDAEYIPHRPWITLVPLGASLVSSFLLWCVLWLAARIASGRAAPFIGGYRVFLGLFWLTAPIAWLYAIPVERFMEPAEAVKANYALLAVVSAWRVFIMIRVAQVFTGRKPMAAVTLVVVYGYMAMAVALWFSPWHVLDLMGGVQRTEIEAAHMDVVNMTTCLSVVAFPAVFVWMMVHLMSSLHWRGARRPAPALMRHPRLDTPAGKDLWALALGSILVWAAVLPFTQPPLIGKPTEADLVERYRERRREWWQQRDGPPPVGPTTNGPD